MCLFKCLSGLRECQALRGTRHLRAQGSPTGLPQPRPGPSGSPSGPWCPRQPPEQPGDTGPLGTEAVLATAAGDQGGVCGSVYVATVPSARPPPTPTRRRPHPCSYSVPRPWHRPGGHDGTGTIAWLVVSGTQKCAFTSPTRPRLCPPGAVRVPLRCCVFLGQVPNSTAAGPDRSPWLGVGFKIFY